ncbi:hypothetical protein BDV3_004701 [Batrachochytrium dendrobatidis]
MLSVSSRQRMSAATRRFTGLVGLISHAIPSFCSSIPPVQTAASCAGFHTGLVIQSRFPAQIKRISRKSHERNLLKIAQLKAKLGEKYRPLGREKRFSPHTDRRSPSQASQPPRPIPKPVRLTPFLVSKSNYRPLDIVPGNIDNVLVKSKAWLDEIKTTAESASASQSTSQSANMGIRQRAFKAEVKNVVNDHTTTLKLPNAAVSKVPESITSEIKNKVHSRLITKQSTLGSKVEDVKTESNSTPDLPIFEPTTAVGPFYRYGLTPSDVETILSITPEVLVNEGQIIDAERAEEQAEMVRRIISLENGRESTIRKFNIARSIEIFQRMPGDTGSPEVQAAIFSVRIAAIQNHLKINRKDKSTKRQLQKWVSKRESILKYLRRKNLSTFVKTCQSIGVDPDTIRV